MEEQTALARGQTPLSPPAFQGSVKVRRGMKKTPHPHDKQNVGVRGPFAGDKSIAFEVCHALDFDGPPPAFAPPP